MRTAALPSCSQNIGGRSTSPPASAGTSDVPSSGSIARPSNSRRVCGAGHVEDRRHDVRQVARRVADRARLADAARPVHDQRRRDAALVDPVLVEPERRVRQVGPGACRSSGRCSPAPGITAGVVAEVHRLARCACASARSSAAHQLVDGHVLGDVLGAGAVVGEEDRSACRRAGPVRSQRVEDAADALVHAVDLRRVDLHAAQQPGLVLGLAPRPAASGRAATASTASSSMPSLDAAARSRCLAQRVPARRRSGRCTWRCPRRARAAASAARCRRRRGRTACRRAPRCVLLDVAHRLVADRVGVEERVVAPAPRARRSSLPRVSVFGS